MRFHLLLCLLALLALLVGCGGGSLNIPAVGATPAPEWTVPATPAPAGETPEQQRVRELSDAYAAASAEAGKLGVQLGLAKDAAKAAKALADQERIMGPIRAGVAWLAWIGLFVGAAGAALLVLLNFWDLGIGKRTAWALACGGPCVAGFALGFGEVAPYLARAFFWALILGAAGGVGWIIYQLVHSNLALGAQWKLYAGRLAQVAPDEIGELNRYSHALQDNPTVKRIVDRVLDLSPQHHLPATQPSDAAA
jgi:hypothetical protein